MSAVLSVSPEEELRQKQLLYNTWIENEADFIANSPVQYGIDPEGESLSNPNVTLGRLISRDEQKILAAKNNPALLDLQFEVYPGDKSDFFDRADKIMQQKVLPYAKAPVPYIMEERHPSYTEALKRYREGIQRKGYESQFRDYPSNQPTDVGQYGPREPDNLEMRKKLASWGWDPDLDQYSAPFLREGSLRPWGKGTKLRMATDIALNSRFMSPDQLAYVLTNNGIEFEEGSARYVMPDQPRMGISFIPKGETKPKVYDFPYIEPSDILELLLQEGPVIAGDVLGTGKAGKLMDTLMLAKPIKGPLSKIIQIMGLSGASGLSAGISDATRMGIGAATGANNLTAEEIIKEAGFISLLSSGGTLVVTTLARVVPYIIETIAGKQVPPSFYRALDDALVRTKKSEAGETLQAPGMYSEEITMQQIYDFVEEMGQRIGKDFRGTYPPTPGKYQPSLSARAQSQQVAAIEEIFLNQAERAEGAKAFQLLKEGNEDVINQLFRGMQDALGEDILADVTAAELGEATRLLVSDQTKELFKNSQIALDDVLKTINAGDNEAESIAVQSLLDEVPLVGRTTKMMPRTTSRLNAIKEEYVDEYTKAFDDAVNSPKYATETTITGGAGYTSKPMERWVNINKATTNRLFKEGGAEADEARALLEQIVGNKTTIIRLRGREPITKQFEGKDGNFYEVIVPGRFKKPNFTLKELNEARTDINAFASQTTNKTAHDLARDLEKGIELQMYATVRAMAKEKSGLTGKKLNTWMAETGYGKEITDSWLEMSKALSKANSDFYLSLAAQPAEKIVNTFLRTNVRGAPNTKIKPVLEMLEETGKKELGDIRQAMAYHIRTNVVGSGEKSALEQAKAYREFWVENKGTLEAIYGKDVYKSFPTLKAFREHVIEPLEYAATQAAFLRELFQVDNPRATVGNIVSDVLEAGSTSRSSGEALLNQQRIIEVVQDSPELVKNMGEVAQSWLVRRVVKPDPSMPGKFGLDLDELTRLLYDDFSTAGTSGQKLTFESFFAPFLGRPKTVKGKVVWDSTQGKEYVQNLKIIHAMLEREAGIPITNPGIIATMKEMIEAALPQTARIRRTMLPVLSIVGRRTRVLEEVVGERSAAAFGEILLDDRALQATVDYLMGKYNAEQIARILASYGIVHYMDIGNEQKLYNESKKEFPKKQEVWDGDYLKDNIELLFSDVGEE